MEVRISPDRSFIPTAGTPRPSVAAEVDLSNAAVGDRFEIGDYGAAVFDLDGTVWLSGEPIRGAVKFLDSLREREILVAFATNISMSSLDEVRAKLLACGLARVGEHVVTSSYSVALTVARAEVREVVALCSPALKAGLIELGVAVADARDVDRAAWRTPEPSRAVVMAGWPECTLREIETIGQLAAYGNPIYVSSLDPGFPAKDGYEPGAGMMVAAARALHSFEPIICGKPSVGYATAVLDGLAERGLGDRRLVMFGDSQRADTGLAHLMGADSVLIIDDRKRPSADLARPTFVAPSVAAASFSRYVD
jgi:glycerol-1-phosphatase